MIGFLLATDLSRAFGNLGAPQFPIELGINFSGLRMEGLAGKTAKEPNTDVTPALPSCCSCDSECRDTSSEKPTNYEKAHVLLRRRWNAVFRLTVNQVLERI